MATDSHGFIFFLWKEYGIWEPLLSSEEVRGKRIKREVGIPVTASKVQMI